MAPIPYGRDARARAIRLSCNFAATCFVKSTLRKPTGRPKHEATVRRSELCFTSLAKRITKTKPPSAKNKAHKRTKT
eukprot:723340-Pyramimonas_sp.AAC.1